MQKSKKVGNINNLLKFMELQEFIKNTLVSIGNGLHEANEEFAKQKGKKLGEDFTALFVMEPFNREKGEGYITFDVAVTVSQESKKSGGGGLKIAVASLGGEVGDVKSQEYISRIKFHILPCRYIG
ncbi:MAG TPA: hypothetical protein PKX03_02000 [Candidatus Paceibacterota bacterium]|nr:hypothetical protein [Candidatus Paceibacterota bacterium]